MSLRLRILALVSLVAVSAVAATAYLAFRQAARQVTESAAADQQTITRIVDELTSYARRHGTWEGVPRTVRELSTQTGQRIKLVTESGTVVVDTDTLQGRTARGVPAPPVLVDPRPTLTLPPSRITPGAPQLPAEAVVVSAIPRYRAGVRFAACLTRQGVGVTVHTDNYGLPDYQADAEAVQNFPWLVADCRDVSVATDENPRAADAVASCRLPTLKAAPDPRSSLRPTATGGPPDADDLAPCLQRTFTKQTADVAPVPLRVYLGATGDPGPSLPPGPVAAAAVLVALLAVAGTALLSRRVLQPIGELTAASRRLGEGDLGLRVPAQGRDELTQLALSFNRMADSLQRGEERQRRLIADVAHELRTPLANLRGYLEALKDGVMPASPELFASLHEEAVLQQRIVDDLQDLALAEAGALAYHRTRVDVAELLETCRTAHQAVAEAAGVALSVSVDEPGDVDADPDRLRQVLGNLVSNALRASAAGGSITLSARRTGDAIEIRVADSGHGIAEADLPYVFDRFWRADAARGRTTGGSGLGLAIARQIVTDHSGTVAVSSARGGGTVFTITLPAAR